MTEKRLPQEDPPGHPAREPRAGAGGSAGHRPWVWQSPAASGFRDRAAPGRAELRAGRRRWRRGVGGSRVEAAGRGRA